MVVPLALRDEPLSEKVSWISEADFHCTGAAPPEQFRLMLYPLGIAVSAGAEQVWLLVLLCLVCPALCAQTVISRWIGLPVDGVTVELICHSPGWNAGVAAWAPMGCTIAAQRRANSEK